MGKQEKHENKFRALWRTSHGARSEKSEAKSNIRKTRICAIHAADSEQQRDMEEGSRAAARRAQEHSLKQCLLTTTSAIHCGASGGRKGLKTFCTPRSLHWQDTRRYQCVLRKDASMRMKYCLRLPRAMQARMSQVHRHVKCFHTNEGDAQFFAPATQSPIRPAKTRFGVRRRAIAISTSQPAQIRRKHEFESSPSDDPMTTRPRPGVAKAANQGPATPKLRVIPAILVPIMISGTHSDTWHIACAGIISHICHIL